MTDFPSGLGNSTPGYHALRHISFGYGLKELIDFTLDRAFDEISKKKDKKGKGENSISSEIIRGNPVLKHKIFRMNDLPHMTQKFRTDF